jgi:hypothetical protein
VSRSVTANVAARLITPEDGKWIVEEARAAAVP